MGHERKRIIMDVTKRERYIVTLTRFSLRPRPLAWNFDPTVTATCSFSRVISPTNFVIIAVVSPAPYLPVCLRSLSSTESRNADDVYVVYNVSPIFSNGPILIKLRVKMKQLTTYPTRRIYMHRRESSNQSRSSLGLFRKGFKN